MTIETKYNIGDEVWLAIKGKPHKVTITTYKYEERNLLCGLVDCIGRYFELPEYTLFPTKEELLKSL